VDQLRREVAVLQAQVKRLTDAVFGGHISPKTITTEQIRIGNWVIGIEGPQPYPLVIRDVYRYGTSGDYRHAFWNKKYRDYN
jgi:hypothetical protein